MLRPDKSDTDKDFRKSDVVHPPSMERPSWHKTKITQIPDPGLMAMLLKLPRQRQLTTNATENEHLVKYISYPQQYVCFLTIISFLLYDIILK